jgi:AcrR family transcriptional regulator
VVRTEDDVTTDATMDAVPMRTAAAAATATAPSDGYHHGDLREACISAGLRLLEEGGADAVTIRGVARLTGVSHTAPLHHFPHREALLDAIAQRGFDRMLAALAASVPDAAAPPVVQLHAYGMAYVDTAIAYPRLFDLMFGRPRDAVGETAGLLLVDLCGAAIARGDLVGSDPLRLSHLLWSAVHGLASLYVSGYLGSGFVTGETPDAHLAADHLLDDLFGALAPRPGRTPRIESQGETR